MKSAQALPVFVVFLTIFCIIPNSADAQQWAGILDPSRAIDWSKAGVVGGIPSGSWTQCGSTIAPYSGTAAVINTAIQNCSNNQYVLLGNGAFNLSSGISWGTGAVKSNVVLRGAGANQTLLVFTGGGDGCRGAYSNICIASSDTNWSGGPSNTANWTAGYAKGTTGITLSSVTNLKVGYTLILDQADDTSDTNSVFVCSDNTITPPCSLEDNINNGQRAHRNQTQFVTVVSCGTANIIGQACNGTNVTISPALYMANWSSTKSPGAWWATSPVFLDGIENLSIDSTGSSGIKAIEIFNCSGCWVSGVRSIDSGKAHVEIQESNHTTVQNSYLYLTQNAVSQSYGIEALNAGDDLYVNNISQYVAEPWMINGACTGCVVAYNYSINNYYVNSAGYVAASSNQHTGGVALILFEGNIGGGGIYGDNFHGTHNLVTFFRNWWAGWQSACYSGSPNGFSACTSNLTPADIRSYSRFYNFVGNVLGHSGSQTSYTLNQTTPTPWAIFQLGNGNTEGSVTVPSDPLVAATIMRWGNYDTFNAASRFVSSEVPSGLAAYANPVPASETLPPSFYLSTKPSWWPSTKPFPPIGPDVTGGNVSTGAGHVYSIPAEDCFLNVMGGPADGTGSALSFNPAGCYPASSASLPPAPSGLQATVQQQ